MSTDNRPLDEQVTVFACGPSSQRCKCECGTPGGKCEHKWDGDGAEHVDEYGATWSATCSRCGMEAISHDMWVGP